MRKQYYATLCEFYLDKPVTDYMPDKLPCGNIDMGEICIDENGDASKVFRKYRFAEYGWTASLGVISDEALRLFQSEVCKCTHLFSFGNTGPFFFW